MSRPLQLPFKFQINAPINGVLKKQKQQVRYTKQIIFVTNRILKSKLKAIFKLIKNQSTRSPQTLMKSLLMSMKQVKKQPKISYLPYSVIQVYQPQVPKTVIFNSRLRKIKAQVFYKLKQFFFDLKSFQVTTVLQNRQNQLLNHLIPKIQQKIYIYAFRNIIEYSREKKGKNIIVKLIQRICNNVTKRVFYKQFFNRIQNYKGKQGKTKLALQKIFKNVKTNLKFNQEVGFRKIQNYGQHVCLQKKLSQKKQRISKIYDINAQKTVILQKQRQILRNLKYKLDHQSVEKNHVLTQKRRTLMLARTKLHEQSKVLNDQIQSLSADVFKFNKILQKQSFVLSLLQKNKKFIKDSKRKGVDFEVLTLNIYKTISDMMNEDYTHVALQLLQVQQMRNGDLQNIPTFDQVSNSRQYLCRKLNILQRIIAKYQRKQPQLNGSILRPITHSLSTSQLKMSPSNISLTASRINTQPSGLTPSRIKSSAEPNQVIKQKQQYLTIFSVVSLILNKYYDMKIKEMIVQEIEQLSKLLAHQ